MFKVVLIALLGVGVGYMLRRLRWLRHVNVTITLTICLMLFVLGVSVGANEVIVRGAWQLGGTALLISVAAILGSAAAGWLVWHFALRPAATEGKEAGR